MGSGAATDRRLAVVVLAAGLVAVLAALAFDATRSVRRLAGSNGVGSVEFVAVVGAGQVFCQRAEDVPQGAGTMRMTIGTYDRPGPLLRSSVQSADGRRVLAGRLAPGWRQGIVDVPLGTSDAPGTPGALVCLANRGAHRIALGGAPLGRRAGARVDGRPARGRVRIEYVDGRRTSATDLAGTIASRMQVARGLWGGAAPWVALALLLLGVGGAARALLAAGDDPHGPAAAATDDPPAGS